MGNSCSCKRDTRTPQEQYYQPKQHQYNAFEINNKRYTRVRPNSHMARGQEPRFNHETQFYQKVENAYWEPNAEVGSFILRVKSFQIKRNQVEFIQYRFPGVDMNEIMLVLKYGDQRYMLHTPKNELRAFNDLNEA